MTTKVPVELSSTPGIVDGSNATAITIDSSEDVTLAGHLVFADSKNAKFGAGSDLQIYHNGSHSYISDQGTGNLHILTNHLSLHNAADDKIIFHANDDGYVIMPNQPAFNVTRNAFQSNLAINSTTTVLWQTEIFDQNADFASNTFTAPVTGRYQFNVCMRLQAIDSAAAYYQTHLQTSNRNYEIDLFDPTEFNGDLNYYTIKGSIFADMDANDTAIVSIHQADGTAQTDISYSADTHFSGFLVC